MNIKNIGIYAHVDAGKTTITEHLLYRAGAIRRVGRVDDGSTQTDTMELERKRGISIQAAPVSFIIGDTKVNLIDTPGHSDFVAEVERSMNVLDGAILVISAREGIQSHTSLLFEALSQMKIPTIIFINKIDRVGVDIESLLLEIKAGLTTRALAVQRPIDVGSRDCYVSDVFVYDKQQVVEFLSDFSDQILEQYLADQAIEQTRLNCEVKQLSRNGIIYPVLFGSALQGIGICELIQAIDLLLPNYASEELDDAKPAGVAFKIKRKNNERQTYVRLYQGTLLVREYLNTTKITRMEGLIGGKEKVIDKLNAGDIGILYGIDDLKVGQQFGNLTNHKSISLGNPTIKVRIRPVEPLARHKLLDALQAISEEDPFLEYEISDIEGDIFVNIFGDIQMEILQDRLREEYDLLVGFEDAITIYKEAPIGTGECYIYKYDKNYPFYASVGLRVEPNEQGKGVEYQSTVPTGTLPKSFQNGIEDGIKNYISQGLKGWELTDIKITLFKGDYCSVNSTPADFRDLTPIVLMQAVAQAKTKLLWPMYRYKLKIPQAVLGRAIADLISMKAEFNEPETQGEFFMIKGTIPVELCRKYELTLRAYTEGRGVFITQFAKYADAPADIDVSRSKTKVDPLNKVVYLLSKRGVLHK